MNVPRNRAFARSFLFCEFTIACICYISFFTFAQLVQTILVLRFTARTRLLNTSQRGRRLKGEGKGVASLLTPLVSLPRKTPFPSTFKRLPHRLSKYVKPRGITVLQPVGLISSMDRALRPVIAKVRVPFPVKPGFFQDLLSTASDLFIQLRGSCSLKSTTRLSECPPSNIKFRNLTVTSAVQTTY